MNDDEIQIAKFAPSNCVLFAIIGGAVLGWFIVRLLDAGSFAIGRTSAVVIGAAAAGFVGYFVDGGRRA